MLLKLQNVSKSFSGLQVVNGVSLTVEPGQIVSLIGPNGAGKSTLINLITGLYTADSGDIRLEGRSICGLPPHRITARGIARTFQTLRLFLNMSVTENVMSAAYPHMHANLLQIALRTPAFRREERRVRQQAEEKLAFFGERLIGYRFDQPVYSLSYANRRRVEIARALMTEPRVLLLDEPAAGMNPQETQEITGMIRRISEIFGCGILLIEHDMSVIADVSDRVVALDHGEVIAAGSFETVTSHEDVIEAYLGKPSDKSRSKTDVQSQ